MRFDTTLLYAAILPASLSAAARWGVRNGLIPRDNNNNIQTNTSSPIPSSTTVSTSASPSGSQEPSSFTATLTALTASGSLAKPPTPIASNRTGTPTNGKFSTYTGPPPEPVSINPSNGTFPTEPPPSPPSFASSGPAKSSVDRGPATSWCTSLGPCPPDHRLSTSLHPSSTCTPLPENAPLTKFMVIYTSTVTVYGNSSNLMSPFKALSTPDYCSPTRAPPLPVASSHQVNPPHYTGPPSSTAVWSSTSIVTLVTTAKQPSTSYHSDPPPGYSQTWLGGGGGSGGQHHPPPHRVPAFTMTFAGDGNDVTIDDQTWSNLGAGESTVVTVGHGTFTIEPTAVVGEGLSLAKPQPAGTFLLIPTPTSAVLDGVSVAVTGTQAVVDGTTINIGGKGTTTMVDGKSVSVGAGSVVVDGSTLTFAAYSPQTTNIVVAGGELLTAIGPSVLVIDSTTLTYGPGVPPTTDVVDDDTITIGPSGAIFDGTTIGGPNASGTEVRYQIVGGATITELGASLAVINGTTYTVGPGAKHITTSFGGETITIEPEGVAVSGVTFSYPFIGSTVTTVMPSGTWVDHFPQVTGSTDDSSSGGGGGGGGDGDGDDDDSGAMSSLQSSMGWVYMCVCIATGVWVLF